MAGAEEAEKRDEGKVASVVCPYPETGARPERKAGKSARMVLRIALSTTVLLAAWSRPAVAGPFEAATTTVRDILPNSDSGIVSEVRLAEVLVRSQRGGVEVHYNDTPTTVYEDEAGRKILREAIAVGMRVTVQYSAVDGGRKRADRVVVDRRTGGKTIAPTVVEMPAG